MARPRARNTDTVIATGRRDGVVLLTERRHEVQDEHPRDGHHGAQPLPRGSRSSRTGRRRVGHCCRAHDQHGRAVPTDASHPIRMVLPRRGLGASSSVHEARSVPAAQHRHMDDVTAEEVARLRARVLELEAQAQVPDGNAKGARHEGRGRAILSTFLIVIACVLAPLSATAVWASTQISDTEAYVKTVAPLADDPGVQKEVADAVTTAIVQNLNLDEVTHALLVSLAVPGQGAAPHRCRHAGTGRAHRQRCRGLHADPGRAGAVLPGVRHPVGRGEPGRAHAARRAARREPGRSDQRAG